MRSRFVWARQPWNGALRLAVAWYGLARLARLRKAAEFRFGWAWLARFVRVGLTAAWQGMSRQARNRWASSGRSRRGRSGEVRKDKLRQGSSGLARRALARNGTAGQAWLGFSLLGQSRRGWLGLARSLRVCPGLARRAEAGVTRLGPLRLPMAWQGQEWQARRFGQGSPGLAAQGWLGAKGLWLVESYWG